MVKRSVVLAVVLAFIIPGCNVTQRIVKDLAIQDMDYLKEKYVGETAWTRSLLIDLGPEGIIDRDVKVEVIDLELHWNGAVTVKGPNRRAITHGLNIERPVTKEAFEAELNKLFWFIKPEKRYRLNLRKYGKKTSKAIFAHELFKGMKREAALESWGYPDEMNVNEVGGQLSEQWIYKDPRQRGKKSYIYIVDGAVDNWEE